MQTFYLGIFPTPGGDKHHLFSLREEGGTLSGTITNSMGSTELENCVKSQTGFSADMPAGPGKHHFDATYTDGGIHVVGTVIMEGNPVGTYEADMALTTDGSLPDDPDGPSGPPDGPGGLPPQRPDPVNDPLYKTLYPGVYTPEEEQLLRQIREDLYYHRVDGTSGVKPNSGTGPAQVDFTMTEDMLRGFAYANNQYNPLFTDPEYAKGTKWGQIIAAPCMQPTDVQFPSLPDNTGIYDGIQRFVPGKGLDHEVYFLRPLVAGKHYHSVNYYDTVEDLTDPKGSTVRAFRIAGYGALVDDLGQEYVKIRHSTVEIYGMLKDKSKAADYPSDLGRTIQARSFEPVRQYTDADYEKMMDLWRKEYVRGKDTLYWEDVNIGDEPTPTCEGPRYPGSMPMDRFAPRVKFTPTKEEMEAMARREERSFASVEYMFYPERYKEPPADAMQMGGPGGPGGPGSYGEGPAFIPKARDYLLKGEYDKLKRDNHGIWMLKEDEGLPASADEAPKYKRSSWSNTTGRTEIARFLSNYAGDDGFVSAVCWRLAFWPYLGVNPYPAEYDRPSYLQKVPYMKDRYMEVHGCDGMASITRGYVTDKYTRFGKHYIDLACWCEDIDGRIWCEGYGTIELPSRSEA